MSVSMDSYLSIKSFQPSCMSTIPERRNQEGESVFDLQFGKLQSLLSADSGPTMVVS